MVTARRSTARCICAGWRRRAVSAIIATLALALTSGALAKPKERPHRHSEAFYRRRALGHAKARFLSFLRARGKLHPSRQSTRSIFEVTPRLDLRPYFRLEYKATVHRYPGTEVQAIVSPKRVLVGAAGFAVLMTALRFPAKRRRLTARQLAAIDNAFSPGLSNLLERPNSKTPTGHPPRLSFDARGNATLVYWFYEFGAAKHRRRVVRVAVSGDVKRSLSPL